MQFRIRWVRSNGPTRYMGTDQRWRARMEDAPPFSDQRSALRVANKQKRHCVAGDSLEVGEFVPERVSSELPWTPFEPAVSRDNTPILEDKIGKPEAIWMNSRYTVFVYEAHTGEGWPAMVHLSIKRNDKLPLRDWRDLQRIKNELVGPEHEAVEIFPAESRLVDTANQYHLFVLKDAGVRFPFGWTTRLVQGDEKANAKQRPFEKEPS